MTGEERLPPVVIDEDPDKGGDVGPFILPPTLTTRTPRGGRHLRYAHPRGDGVEIRNSESELAPGVDVRGTGGYVVLPPSVLKDGRTYRWEDEYQPIADLPGRMLILMQKSARPPREPHAAQGQETPRHYEDAGAHWLSKALAMTSDGTGDRTGYWLAQQLLCARVPNPDVVLLSYARAATMNPANPFDERDVERWLVSARRSEIVQRGEPARSQTVINFAAHQHGDGAHTARSHHTFLKPPDNGERDKW